MTFPYIRITLGEGLIGSIRERRSLPANAAVESIVQSIRERRSLPAETLGGGRRRTGSSLMTCISALL